MFRTLGDLIPPLEPLSPPLTGRHTPLPPRGAPPYVSYHRPVIRVASPGSAPLCLPSRAPARARVAALAGCLRTPSMGRFRPALPWTAGAKGWLREAARGRPDSVCDDRDGPPRDCSAHRRPAEDLTGTDAAAPAGGSDIETGRHPAGHPGGDAGLARLRLRGPGAARRTPSSAPRPRGGRLRPDPRCSSEGSRYRGVHITPATDHLLGVRAEQVDDRVEGHVGQRLDAHDVAA